MRQQIDLDRNHPTPTEMLCVLVLAKDRYPRDMPVFSYEHTGNDSYYSARKEQMTSKAADIKAFIDALPFRDFEIPQECVSQDCLDFCEATSLSVTDFYLFNGFVQAYIDPMAAFYHKNNDNFMSYALRFNENNPSSQKMADLLQKLVYELHATSGKHYLGIVAAGFEGFLAVQHTDAKQFAAFIRQEDCALPDGTSELPAYNEEVFREHVQNYLSNMAVQGEATSANIRIADFILATEGEVIIGDMADYLTAANYYTETIIAVGDFDGTVGFYDGEYQRVASEENGSIIIAQSSCKANLTSFIASDFRMVQVERSVALKTGMSLEDFQAQMRIFPFRTSQTPAMLTINSKSQFATLQKCDEVFDGSLVVACADPPPPASWWSLTLSILIMTGTIVCWVFGCKISKKMEEKAVLEAEE